MFPKESLPNLTVFFVFIQKRDNKEIFKTEMEWEKKVKAYVICYKTKEKNQRIYHKKFFKQK
jgi:hypothetical protein